MAKLLTLGDLQKHFEEAREKLSQDRLAILASSPLGDAVNRDEYGFAYKRAERVGLEAISASLEDVAWLPMQLDPHTEIMSDNRNAMARWLGGAGAAQPDGADFGNDFIHALARTAMTKGFDSAAFRKMAERVGGLFHDLSCLIGLIYYGVWMSENGIEGLPVSDPGDLERTAQEIAALTQSPEVAELLKKHRAGEDARRASPRTQTPPSKGRPVLRVIDNPDWAGV